MMKNTIAVRLNPRLESEKRGLCDPDDPRNSEVITPYNYGPQGYLIVHSSGFIRAQIQAGTLIEVPVEKIPDPKGETSARKAGAGGRKSGKDRS